MPGRWRAALAQALAAGRVPADVQSVLAAAPAERLLTWGRDVDGVPVVATDVGLWGYGERLAWTEIDHVIWTDATLTVLAIDGEARPIVLAEPRDLPVFVRAQVEASVVASRAVPLLPDGRGVTVVARRTLDGGVLWRLRFDPGVPTDDPALTEQAERVLAQMREDLGV
ncbi:MAG TPA: hypothetical protein VGN54_11535 [Mycobacteriales bacterium]|jgi:hypothetical protein|nr:hypothetical protein [Mycobacteriales bacterium]